MGGRVTSNCEQGINLLIQARFAWAQYRFLGSAPRLHHRKDTTPHLVDLSSHDP